MSTTPPPEPSTAPSSPGAAHPRLFTRWGTIACCTAMAGLGLLWAAYGPAIPQLRHHFDVDEAGAGLPLAIQSAGSVLGALGVPLLLLRRLGYRSVFAGAFVALILGALTIGALPVWSAVLVGAVIAGLGLGCCDTLVSQSFIIGQGRHGAAMVNVAHGCFGIGTVLAPLLLSLIGAEHWSVMFLVVAALMLVATTGLPGIARHGGTAAPVPIHAAPRPGRLGIGVILGFLVLYVAHFGVQSGIGSWEPARLMDLGSTERQATLATSGFWLAMVIGRVAAVPITARFRPGGIVIVSCGGMTAAILLAALVPGSTVWAYLLAGLMIGPIFPTGLTWLLTSGYAQGGTFSYVVASALAGSILVPPLLGALFAARGTEALAPTLLVVAVVAVAAAVAVALLLRHGRRAASGSAGDRVPAALTP